ncbi:MAG: UDP-N-acetylmuramoyl-L-alanyl-D-glutamate--2,6-diaminopimelate ligase [Bryobacteraceae bacterium]|nr:UDP-N-acetylmuramoyl-L-alanyl-D-glutamate--2,6-diaminopimelate ligase [Bryobacteraceae bacterium]
MTLSEVLAGVPLKSPVPDTAGTREVRGLAYDSRKTEQDFLFFAFPGARADGRQFASEAIAKGALAILSELPAPDTFGGVWLRTEHGRRALARTSATYFNHPDRRLFLTGITGTNGKTTTSYLLDSILRQAGKTTALVGTIEYRLAGRKLPAINTTPESLDLFELFVQLEQQGGTHATLEVSSHALALGRVHAIQFHTAVFTNLTRDHLDFHRTMEEYFAAKQQIFLDEDAVGPRFAVLNRDDEQGRSIRTKPGTEVVWYGIEEGAQARAVRIASGFEGLRFEIQYNGREYPIESPLAGRVNVCNILAAWCAAFSEGIRPEVIAAGIASLSAVPGRFERISEGQTFLVIVDYAHTDDALRNTIAAARALTRRRVITLFGCGGDRDRAKRPLMGMAAADASDFVIVTSDNPRSEDPLDIINDALVGVRRFNTPHLVEPDRAKAIRNAIEEANSGDVVILAGKGHESYQVLNDRTIDFDDRAVARQVLQALGYKKLEA